MELSSPGFQRPERTTAHNGIAIPVKTVQLILYAVAVLLLSAAIAWLFAAVEHSTLSPAGSRVALALVFWAFGLAHIFIYHPLLSLLQQRSGWVFSVVLAVLVSAATYGVFIIVHLYDWVLAVTAGAAFLLPHVLQQLVFNFFNMLPSKDGGWVIPEGAEPDKRMSLMLNSMHFKIRIRVKAGDMDSPVFSVNLPSKLQLSTVFLRFLYDRQNEIEIVDATGARYGWNFYVVRRLGVKRMLQPDLTLAENGVRKGDVIHIERLAPLANSLN